MGIIDYGDIIRRAKNRIFNATKKNLKKLLKHPKKFQRQLKFLHQKKVVDQPQTSNLKTLKTSIQKLNSAILLRAGLAVFLTCKII